MQSRSMSWVDKFNYLQIADSPATNQNRLKRDKILCSMYVHVSIYVREYKCLMLWLEHRDSNRFSSNEKH